MNKAPKIKVVKANGETELYSRKKFRESLSRSGAGSVLIDKIQEKVERELKEGMTTGQLYDLAKNFLAEESISSATKYSLKKAIMDLGPAGYFFEKYLAAVLNEYGYKTRTNLNIKGECISHEVDVLAEKEDVVYIIEAKYHNSRGIKSGTKTVLYTYSRFLDIKAGDSKFSKAKPWLITNTKFTTKAVKYGKCRGIKISGWRYPKDESLEGLVENKNLYPVTALPSVNNYARKELIKVGVIFARDIKKFSVNDLVKKFKIYKDIAQKIKSEADDFVNNHS
jgi:Holliday junction resolvase-like predicted endonuclease